MVRKTHPTLLNNAPPAPYVIGFQVVQVCVIRATGYSQPIPVALITCRCAAWGPITLVSIPGDCVQDFFSSF